MNTTAIAIFVLALISMLLLMLLFAIFAVDGVWQPALLSGVGALCVPALAGKTMMVVSGLTLSECWQILKEPA